MEGQPGHPEAFYGEYVSGCGDTTKYQHLNATTVIRGHDDFRGSSRAPASMSTQSKATALHTTLHLKAATVGDVPSLI
jgi:hypothetical protein